MQKCLGGVSTVRKGQPCRNIMRKSVITLSDSFNRYHMELLSFRQLKKIFSDQKIQM